MTRNFGQVNNTQVLEDTAQGFGATGLGLLGALVGAAVVSQVKPEWWVGGALTGFIVPMALFAPKKKVE